MTDTAPMDDSRRDRFLDEIPAMKRMISDMHVALMGDMRTGASGLIADHREHGRRITDLESRTNRQSEKIHTMQAAGGNHAKRAWWEVAKAAIAGALGAAGVWLASGRPPHP